MPKSIISLQISEDLLERFERVRNRSGFNSKSQALREAIVKFIEEYEKLENLEGYRIMTINLVYPFREVIINEIAELYSQYHQIIKNVSDWRIAEKKIEIILTVGRFDLIRDLRDKLSNIKDVISSMHEVVID